MQLNPQIEERLEILKSYDKFVKSKYLIKHIKITLLKLLLEKKFPFTFIINVENQIKLLEACVWKEEEFE